MIYRMFLMKKRFHLLYIAIILTFFSGCGAPEASTQVAATTLPVYEFTSRI